MALAVKRFPKHHMRVSSNAKKKEEKSIKSYLLNSELCGVQFLYEESWLKLSEQGKLRQYK